MAVQKMGPEGPPPRDHAERLAGLRRQLLERLEQALAVPLASPRDLLQFLDLYLTYEVRERQVHLAEQEFLQGREREERRRAEHARREEERRARTAAAAAARAASPLARLRWQRSSGSGH
jgi:hypothetical protein